MRFVLVYRIENDSGHGPYIGSEDQVWWGFPDYLNGATRERPTIKRHWTGNYERFEGGRVFEGADELEDYYCGFPHKRLAHLWFGCVRLLLHEAGYRLAIYRVPRRDVLVGKRQCLFRFDDAELVERRRLAA